MSRKYDQKTNAFNEKGELPQVINAIKAIDNTGSSIGIVTADGIVLATEKMEASDLLENDRQSDKVYQIDDHIWCVASGMTADSNLLIDWARQRCQEESIPIEQLVVQICDIKQYKTQVGGQRPYGTAFLFAGWDQHHQWQLYATDPSGNFSGWKAHAIGKNQLNSKQILKDNYKDQLKLAEGENIAIKAIVKTMDTISPNPNKIEIVVLTLGKKNNMIGKTLKENEVVELLKRNDFNKEEKMDQE